MFRAKSRNYNLIKNDLNKLYIGVSKEPNKRVVYHNSKRGSVFTRTGNFNIVLLEKYLALSKARQREIQIKKGLEKRKSY